MVQSDDHWRSISSSMDSFLNKITITNAWSILIILQYPGVSYRIVHYSMIAQVGQLSDRNGLWSCFWHYQPLISWQR